MKQGDAGLIGELSSFSGVAARRIEERQPVVVGGTSQPLDIRPAYRVRVELDLGRSLATQCVEPTISPRARSMSINKADTLHVGDSSSLGVVPVREEPRPGREVIHGTTISLGLTSHAPDIGVDPTSELAAVVAQALPKSSTKQTAIPRSLNSTVSWLPRTAESVKTDTSEILAEFFDQLAEHVR